MSISYDVTATLREQMKHHEPIVLIRGGRCACGFIPRESGKTRSIGYGVEVLPTMNADGNYAVLVYDARGNGGVAYAQQSREITKTEQRTIRR